jgi:uncharacterized protein (TIGR03435 family)
MQILCFQVVVICWLGLRFGAVSAQEFDVASVKPIQMQTAGGQNLADLMRTYESIVVSHGSMSMHYVRLRAAIRWAYDVKDFQISGLSQSGAVPCFEIHAKAAGDTPLPQLRLMLQALLVERFKLVVHREKREFAGFALVATTKSPNLHVTEEDPEEGAVGGGGTVVNGIKISMADFGGSLAGPMGGPVIDMTNLTGRFDFSVNYAPYLPPDVVPTADDQRRAFVDALRERLGLKMEPRKVSVDLLVVDHFDTIPVEN